MKEKKLKIPLLKKPPQHLADLKLLTRGLLRKKYQSTYRSWANAKHRAKLTGDWAEQFDNFADFLRLVGPRPSPKHTLDRIDNDDPEYAPRKVRWSTKEAQANNRSTTRFVPVNGRLEPLAAAARMSGESPRTCWNRLSRKKYFMYPPDPRNYKPWPTGFEDQWEVAYAKRFYPEQTRFQFLISRLRRSKVTLEEELCENHPDDDNADMAERRETYGRVLKFLKRVEAEYPLWQDAVRTFENYRLEAKRMYQNEYLSRDE